VCCVDAAQIGALTQQLPLHVCGRHLVGRNAAADGERRAHAGCVVAIEIGITRVEPEDHASRFFMSR
jgi:hypothetical protein